MKKPGTFISFVLLVFLLNTQHLFSQVNGEIILDTGKITVLKIWGTHSQRGFAYGYFLGAKMRSVYINYIIPTFGSYLSVARSFISEGSNLKIDTAYISEAKALVKGAAAAGVDTTGMDYINLLVGNCLLDLDAFAPKKGGNMFGMGCSALMSWGDATLGTDLNGKSAVTRHLDWDIDQYLNNNQVMVVSLPSEPDEQPWLLIGFAGQISALSGTNNSGLSAFQHVLNLNNTPTFGQQYEPIWFSIRKALEKKDYNQDGVQDVNDIRSVLTDHTQGYAGTYIVTTSASSTAGADSLIAMVAELSPAVPKFTFRTNSFADSIPGDNLYAANDAIARNNAYNFCSRYNSVVSVMGNGTGIGSEQNWEIMRNHSRNTGYNIQQMQVLPESRVLKLAVYKNGRCAYLNDPMIFSLDSLFAPSRLTGVREVNTLNINIYPNPGSNRVYVNTGDNENSQLAISDITGKEIFRSEIMDLNTAVVSTDNLPDGIYLVTIHSKKGIVTRKLVIQR